MMMQSTDSLAMPEGRPCPCSSVVTAPTIAAMDTTVQEASLPRPEEMIASIYGELDRQRSNGRTPCRVVLGMDWYRSIQAYRTLVGTLESPGMDYLGKDCLFGLEIWVDAVEGFTVS